MPLYDSYPPGNNKVYDTCSPEEFIQSLKALDDFIRLNYEFRLTPKTKLWLWIENELKIQDLLTPLPEIQRDQEGYVTKVVRTFPPTGEDE